MKLKSIIELTPLLDVFLILIFAFMINTKESANEQQLALEMAQHENSMLNIQLQEQTQQLQQYRQNLDSSQIRVLRYEQELAEQKELLTHTLSQVERKLSLFFEQQEQKLQAQSNDGSLTENDYQNFADHLEKMELNPSASFIEQVYILGELNAYASTITVYLDDSNQVWINRTPTELSLNSFDEKLGQFDPESVAAFSQQLQMLLKEHYNQRKKGENKLGEVVLLTFGHSNTSMRGVIRLVGNLTESFYQEMQQTEGSFRKIFYSNLGFYPFETQAP